MTTHTDPDLALAQRARERNDDARLRLNAMLSAREIIPENADSLAFSLKDVPDLAAAVERLVQERDALQARLENALNMIDRRWR